MSSLSTFTAHPERRSNGGGEAGDNGDGRQDSEGGRPVGGPEAGLSDPVPSDPIEPPAGELEELTFNAWGSGV
ncbi:hypothetical protein LTR86_009328 [Recurvomyces mirabilis]|nr:hypothetical protein LTR86_009328 [Recurvomyces mirabilis]